MARGEGRLAHGETTCRVAESVVTMVPTYQLHPA